ncbi:MAG TPA: PLP-dependent aminotransferase family protein [Solirubrobacteraceae bacterium]|nr:PLP-dependent aminotransferase family protein [Solirubrobacteraceae bacterium]
MPPDASGDILNAARLVELLGQWRLDGPASQRLAATIRTLVLDGQIPLETRLPPERELARSLGLSRASVTAAYDLLRADGYVTSRRGAGSWAAIPAGHLAASDSVSRVDGLDLRIAAMPAPAGLDELARAASTQLPRWLDHHGYDPLGLPPLRAAIARRFTERGLRTRPEQVMVTAGALHALDLAIRAFTRRGRNAVVEIPGYPAALDAVRNAGLRIRSIPTNHNGWDIDTLVQIAHNHRPQLAYLIPDFQNPTGAVIDSEARRIALETLSDADALVVIDETFVELNLERAAAPRPMASFADARAITVGSLSKAVWGGLRTGWIRADPPLIQRLATARATVDLASPTLDQLLAVHVLERLDEIMTQRRESLRQRRAALADALRIGLPDWQFAIPRGGQFIWAELPGPISTRLTVSAAEHDVHLTPGPRFGAAGLLERYLRLPYTLPPEQLRHAISILARVTPAVGSYSADARARYVA